MIEFIWSKQAQFIAAFPQSLFTLLGLWFAVAILGCQRKKPETNVIDWWYPMFLQEECFINIIKDLILSKNRGFVAMTNRNGFIINIVSNFVIRHISMSKQLLVLISSAPFYLKSFSNNWKRIYRVFRRKLIFKQYHWQRGYCCSFLFLPSNLQFG